MAGETGDDWIDVDKVKAVLGDDLAADVDDEALAVHTVGAASYVQGRRSDLFREPMDEAGDVVLGQRVFVPTASVVHGTALLAYRFYSRRTTPLGVVGFTEDGATGILRDDPDIARLLGIGRHGRFVFGAAR